MAGCHRVDIRVCFTIALLVGLTSSGCSTGNEVKLPDLPELALEGMVPTVREQVRAAYLEVRESPERPAANGRLGMVLHAYGQYAQAEVWYQRAKLLDPNEFQWAYYLGTVQFLQGKDSAAVDTLREALRLDSAYVPAQLKLAESLLAAGEIEESGQIYAAAVREHPESALAHYGLGRAESARGEVAAAIEHYAKACELANTFGAAHYALALAYRDAGEAEKSRLHLSLYEKHQGVQQPLEDRLLYALSELKSAGAKDHFERGLHLADTGNLTQAAVEFEQALASDPELAQARVNLLSLYGGLGQIEKAEEQYRAAVELNINRPDLHFNFGVLMGQQERYAEAEKAFRKALEVNPSMAEAHNNLGQMLEAQGRLKEAAECYRLALKHKPDYRLAHFHMGRVLFAQGKNEEAARHFLGTLTPEDEETPKYMLDVAVAFAKMGDDQKARDFARQARRKAAALGQADVVAMSEKVLARLGETGR